MTQRQDMLSVETIATGADLDNNTQSHVSAGHTHNLEWNDFTIDSIVNGWVGGAGAAKPQWAENHNSVIVLRGTMDGTSATSGTAVILGGWPNGQTNGIHHTVIAATAGGLFLHGNADTSNVGVLNLRLIFLHNPSFIPGLVHLTGIRFPRGEQEFLNPRYDVVSETGRQRFLEVVSKATPSQLSELINDQANATFRHRSISPNFVNVTLLNGWTTAPGFEPRVGRRSDGLYVLIGQIFGPATWTSDVLFEMPDSTHRPPYDQFLPVSVAGQSDNASSDVGNGRITVMSTDNTVRFQKLGGSSVDNPNTIHVNIGWAPA